VTATQVTFDADIDDLSSSDPDDETTTMFQSAVTVDSESEDGDDSTENDSPTDNEDEREYSTEIIEGVHYLKYHVVIPPDAPNEQEHNGNDNETHEHKGSANATQDEETRPTNKAQSKPVLDALQSSSVDTYTWGEDRFEPTWGRWRDRPIETIREDKTWGEATQKWERNTRQKVITQGGSPPPKLRPEENLFVDDLRQNVPRFNTAASDDLAFRTGRRQDGIVSASQK
jgi:hypothetical protein